ncbi:MAG: AAA family ATPase [Sphingobacteriales bacterium]|nr:MAG: AAA family ATPase [Sphingobacteriales bacterium]
MRLAAGPPGSGKTAMASTIAMSSGFPFIKLKGNAFNSFKKAGLGFETNMQAVYFQHPTMVIFSSDINSSPR